MIRPITAFLSFYTRYNPIRSEEYCLGAACCRTAGLPGKWQRTTFCSNRNVGILHGHDTATRRDRNHLVETPAKNQHGADKEEESFQSTQRNLRFSGVGRVYVDNRAEQALSDTTNDPHLRVVDRLAAATVAVVGLGGVGSWAAEALCRSGIGNIVLIDLDDICISNTNRQLHASTSTVGKLKIHEMKKRMLDINPQCNVTLIHDFVQVDNVDAILDNLLPELTVCLDAIDGQNEKTALIAGCALRAIPIVTCGGAAGRMDPTKIVCDDLTKAQEDRLLCRCRKLLRRYHGFAKGPMPFERNYHKPKRWNVLAVYSAERQKSVPHGDLSGGGSLRQCDGALGTVCFVTGTYGFVAASRVVEMIANDRLIVPRRPTNPQ